MHVHASVVMGLCGDLAGLHSRPVVVVEFEFGASKILLDLRWFPPEFGGTDSFVGFLCPLHAFYEGTGMWWNEFRAILAADKLSGFNYS